MTDHETDELRMLADQYVLGELSPQQLDSLEARLRAGEEARLSFLAYLEVHAGLAWESRGAQSAMPGRREVGLLPTPVESVGKWQAGWPGMAWRWTLPLAAAVVLLLAVASLWQPARQPAHQPAMASTPAVAMVKASLHGQWADGRGVTVGTRMPAGVWEFQSGLVELETASDTVLLVEAPARLELIDALHGRLLGGNLVVRMPKGKSGFVVDLPQLRVTDLGTEFGVSVAPNGVSRVQVFDGKVRAESSSMQGGSELVAGESLRCTSKGVLAAEKSTEDRFIRRFPPRTPEEMAGGPLYSRSTLDCVHIAPPTAPVVIDGNLSEWKRTGAFRSACLPPYEDTYFVEGLMMYDARNLYIGAHVGDPEPMRNAARDDMEFAGGSVIVRVSTDRRLGWPLKGTMWNACSADPSNPPLPDSLSDRVVSIIMSHDRQSGQARIRLQHGFDFHDPDTSPSGWRGAVRKDADGRGYTLEYAIPWQVLHCADDPPQPGDVLAALWMVHWSDAEGRLCRGQLVEVTNPQSNAQDKVPPYLFFQNGPCWGRAIYLPAGN
jgi:hypothetical protein